MPDDTRLSNGTAAFWVIVLAIVFAGIDGSLGKILTGGLIGFLVAYVLHLGRRTDQLGRQLTTLETSRLAASKSPAPATADDATRAFDPADSATWRRGEVPPQAKAASPPASAAEPWKSLKLIVEMES